MPEHRVNVRPLETFVHWPTWPRASNCYIFRKFIYADDDLTNRSTYLNNISYPTNTLKNNIPFGHTLSDLNHLRLTVETVTIKVLSTKNNEVARKKTKERDFNKALCVKSTCVTDEFNQ